MFVSPFLLNLNLPVKKETQNIALSQWHYYEHWWSFQSTINVCEDHSVMSDYLWPHGLYSPWNSPGQNTGVGSLSLLQGIFPTQGLNPGLPLCRRILYQLSHKGSPRKLEWVAYPFSSRSSWPMNRSGVSCTASGFFINWALRAGRGRNWEVVFRGDRLPAEVGEEVLEMDGGDGCPTSEYIKYHWTVHFEMVKMVNFMYVWL